MAHQLEVLFVQKVFYVIPGPREEVVHAQHLAPLFEQSLAKMRAEEASATGNENPTF
jgi:hypothetical protein